MSGESEKASGALLAELNLVLTDRTTAATATRGNLRDAVCDYVIVEQSRGVSVARIIKTVKDILRKAEDKVASGRPSASGPDNELAKQLVDWCVEFHLAARSRAH